MSSDLLLPLVILMTLSLALSAVNFFITLRRQRVAQQTEEKTSTTEAYALLIEQLTQVQEQLTLAQAKLDAQQQRLASLDADFARSDALVREEFARSREETARSLKEGREETTRSLKENRDELANNLKEVRESTEARLLAIQTGNESKLEQMRVTVDEKLQQTVEKRFAESFKLISSQLELVHKGLGEMQQLAGGVSDLKKVLANVKTRGNLGEYQLGAILEQVLSPEQYETNAAPKPRSQERVEFAVRLPSKDDDNTIVLLPIDSKFPVEDYERLLDAYEGTSDETAEAAAARLETRILGFARDIRNKYINPPRTTDFAIMFVPTEGLYAEALRRPGLFERLQRDCHVILTGPTNLVALLNSLQMGFRTLAIEKRSSEVWKTLGAVKTEFGRFEGMLDGVRRKLDSASNDIEKIGSKSRNISRKLGKVQELPVGELTADELGSGELDDDRLGEGEPPSA